MPAVSITFCDELAPRGELAPLFHLRPGSGDRTAPPHRPRVSGVGLVASGAIISIPHRIYASSACIVSDMRISLVLRALPCLPPYHDMRCSRGPLGSPSMAGTPGSSAFFVWTILPAMHLHFDSCSPACYDHIVAALPHTVANLSPPLLQVSTTGQSTSLVLSPSGVRQPHNQRHIRTRSLWSPQVLSNRRHLLKVPQRT